MLSWIDTYKLKQTKTKLFLSEPGHACLLLIYIPPPPDSFDSRDSINARVSKCFYFKCFSLFFCIIFHFACISGPWAIPSPFLGSPWNMLDTLVSPPWPHETHLCLRELPLEHPETILGHP